MKYTIPSYRTMSLALAVIGVFFAANLTVAQEVNEKIIILAPYDEPIKVKRSNNSVFADQIWEIKRRVNIKDLDLSKYADVIKLDSRLENAAKEICQKLSDMFPFNPSSSREKLRCKKKAIASTKKQTERAIAAAN